MANIADFKAQMTGGGARPNQFYAQLTFPTYVGIGTQAGRQAQFLCRSAQLPASTIEPITTLYRGRPVIWAGERTFQPWTVSIYNDTSFKIRDALELWQNGIQNYDATTGRTDPTQYQVDLNVYQLDRAGGIIKQYRFVDAMPVNVGPIQLDFDQQNQIEQFDVEFAYNYFTSNTTPSGGTAEGFASASTLGSFPFPAN